MACELKERITTHGQATSRVLLPQVAQARGAGVDQPVVVTPDVLRRVLNQLARKLDGTPAAATVVARKRAVLFNLLGYAVDKKHFPMNPLMSVRWKSPKAAEAIDRRRVVNPRQARALLDALAEQGPMGRHLVAFFGCIHHAGLRPAEVVMLSRVAAVLQAARGRRLEAYLALSRMTGSRTRKRVHSPRNMWTSTETRPPTRPCRRMGSVVLGPSHAR